MVRVNLVDMGVKGGIVVDGMRVVVVVVVVVVSTDAGSGAGVVAVGPGKSAELRVFETPTRSEEARFWFFENLSRMRGKRKRSSKEVIESLDDVRLALLEPAQFPTHSVHPGRHGSRGHGHRSVRRPYHWRFGRSSRQGGDQRGAWRQHQRHTHVQVGRTRTLSGG